MQKIVHCPPGFVCPTPSSFILNIEVTGDVTMWNPHTLNEVAPAGITQVIINLRPSGTANYLVEPVSPIPPGLTLEKSPFADCQGTIRQTQTKTCTFTNEYRVAIPTT